MPGKFIELSSFDWMARSFRFSAANISFFFFTVNPSHIEHFWRASPLEKGKEERDEKG